MYTNGNGITLGVGVVTFTSVSRVRLRGRDIYGCYMVYLL